MFESTEVEEYIDNVKKEIKWKRAGNVVTAEIMDHIDDLKTCLLEEGMPEKEACKEAINEMGDASMVGKMLNDVHRPKYNWYIVSFICVLAIFGFLITKATYWPFWSIFPLIIGVACMILISVIDYIKVINKSFILYCLLHVVVLACMFYEHKKANGTIYSYFFIMFFPILQYCLIHSLIIKNKSRMELRLVFVIALPLVEAIIIRSYGTLLCLVFVDAIICLSLIRKNRSGISMKRFIILAVLAAFLLITCLFITCLFDYNHAGRYYILDSDGYHIRNMLKNTDFIGGYIGDDNTNLLTRIAYPGFWMAIKYENIIFVCLATIYSILIVLLIIEVKKFRSKFEKDMGKIIVVLMLSQTILTLLSSLGVINQVFEMDLPFIAGGGVFHIYNYCLVGLFLSIVRNKTIVAESLRLLCLK